MKKAILIYAAAAMLSIVGCTKDTAPDVTPSPTPVVVEPTPVPPTPTPVATPPPVVEKGVYCPTGEDDFGPCARFGDEGYTEPCDLGKKVGMRKLANLGCHIYECKKSCQ